MPYKSKAQHRLFRVLEAQGKLPKGTASEWAHHTPNMKKLPEHVKKQKTKQASTPDLYQLVARQLSRGKKFRPEQLDLDKSLYEHGYDDLDLLDTTSRYADLAKNDQLFQEGDIDFGNLKLRELQAYLAQRQTKKAEKEAQAPPNYRQALGMVNTCGNCLNYEAGAGTCNKFKVPVSNDYVCDAYNQNKSMVSQIKLNTNFVSSKPKTDFSSGVEDVKPLEIKSGSSMNNPHAVPMVNPVRPIAGVGFGGSGQAPNNIGMNKQTSKQVGNTVPPGSIVQWLNSQAQQLMKARQPQQQPQQGQPPAQPQPQGQPQQQPPPGQAKQAGFFNLLGQTLDKHFAKEAAGACAGQVGDINNAFPSFKTCG